MVLTQAGTVLCQRFGYPAYRTLTQQRAEVAKGYLLLQDIYGLAKAHNQNKNRSKAAIYTFGIWHDRKSTSPIVSADTKQAKGRNRVEAGGKVALFVVWFNEYTDNFIAPFLEAKFNIEPAIRRSYELRAQVHDWLKTQLAEASTFTHPMFATCSTFSTFCPGAHTDNRDMEYSFMVNFGGSCYLNFPEHDIRLHMQPFDVVFFRSKDLMHSTEATPATARELLPRCSKLVTTSAMSLLAMLVWSTFFLLVSLLCN